MVVLVLPEPKLGGELGDGSEGCASVELFLVSSMTTLHFAVALWAPGRDVPMGNPEITEMPREIRSELVAVVSLDAMNRDGQPATHLVNGGDRVGDRALGINLQNAIAACLINRGELIEPPSTDLQVLDVDLDGLAGLSELAPSAGTGPIRLQDTARGDA